MCARREGTQDAIYDLRGEFFCWFHHFFNLIGRNKNSTFLKITPTDDHEVVSFNIKTNCLHKKVKKESKFHGNFIKFTEKNFNLPQ